MGIHNFKGYGGLPYCPVHYPNPKSFTLVKDSPEMQQVAANTRNMSKVSQLDDLLTRMPGLDIQHFRAAYDYDAADYDEVSFIEGDEILHGEPIDEGWMFGTVKRTGKFGMLPSNYVVPIQVGIYQLPTNYRRRSD
ncbi:unnamed protein product [Mesocestoides corti]|uniref:SH3 domain-containing protein n=1 Tax=Mesocestoides corti TaxID=53468 RepID=A0A3P6H211_MESCO|nr:unnamed protein product [Mesocestoides corti]